MVACNIESNSRPMFSPQSTHIARSIPSVCYVDPITDISGIGTRLASIIPTYISLVLTLLWCWVRNNPSREKLCECLENTLLYLNALQIISAIVVLSTLWQVRHELDFFHMRFGLDLAGFAAWASVFTSLAYPGYARKCLLVIPLLILFLGLGILVLIHTVHVLKVAATDLGCMPLRYYYCYKAGIITIFIIMAKIFGIFGFLNNPNSGLKYDVSKWKTSWLLLALIVPVLGTVLETIWHFMDYNDLKYLLKDTEDAWSFAQRLQIGLVFGGVSLSIWTGMEVDDLFISTSKRSEHASAATETISL